MVKTYSAIPGMSEYRDFVNQCLNNEELFNKEITLKDPPVDEILSEKLFVKIRIKPINPKIIMNIEDKKNISQNSNLSENDFNHLNSNKKLVDRARYRS